MSVDHKDFVLPECINHLKAEKRWVVWKYKKRKDKVTKPPYQSIGGKLGSFASNNQPNTWSTLADAELAYTSSECDGIGLQLQNLSGFAALDFDDVINENGQLLKWVEELINKCQSYAEYTPSGNGIRILGLMPLDTPCIHTRKSHNEGGSFEIYTNLNNKSARYITVSGRKLSACPDILADLSPIIQILQTDNKEHKILKPNIDKFSDFYSGIAQKYNLPTWVGDFVQHGGKGDRSADFQSVVNALRPRGVTFEEALQLFQFYPDGPAAKYIEGNRLENELQRSWQKAGQHIRNYNAVDEHDNDPVDLWGVFSPPELPKGLLPQIIEDFAFEMGEQMGADPSGLAMAALCVCAAAIPDKIQLKVKRHDHWTECSRLWVALVGPPSTKKSPILNAASAPLREMDNALVRKFETERAKYEALSADEKKAIEFPKLQRLRIEDTTVEAAQEVLAESQNGILCLQDELSGFFGQLDKYNGGKGSSADRAFWLRSYNGGEYSLSRIIRGSKLIPNLSVSLLGGIQPEPIRKLANDSHDDGLLQRICPIVLKQPKLGKDEPRPDVAGRYALLINNLLELQHPGIIEHQKLTFDDGAQNIRNKLESRHLDLQSSEIISRKLGSHLGKYDGLFPRLCIVFHCIEFVQSVLSEHRSKHILHPPCVINENTAQRVADFMHLFLLPHAVTFYGGVLGLSNDHDAMTDIAGFILAKKLTAITNRDVQRGSRTMRSLRDIDIKLIFEQLEALGWLKRVDTGRHGAQPHWAVNPSVHTKFARKAAEEHLRRGTAKKMLAQILGSKKP